MLRWAAGFVGRSPPHFLVFSNFPYNSKVHGERAKAERYLRQYQQLNQQASTRDRAVSSLSTVHNLKMNTQNMLENHRFNKQALNEVKSLKINPIKMWVVEIFAFFCYFLFIRMFCYTCECF